MYKSFIQTHRGTFNVLVGYLFAFLVMVAFIYMVGHGKILYFGADFQFHYNRMVEFHQNIAHGNWFPVISTYSANQIGSNVITMYPPFPTYLGALLMFVMPSVSVVYTLLMIQFMLAFGVARFVAARMKLSNIEANVVGILYMTATPLVTQSIQQWVMGEVWAMSFMPLVILGFYRLTYMNFSSKTRFSLKESWSAIVPLVVGFTAISYCHVLSLAIVGVFSAMYAALLMIFNKNRIQILYNLIVSGIWSLILAAAFFVPFVINTKSTKMFTPHADQALNTWSAPQFIGIWEQVFEFRSNTVGIIGVISIILGFFLFFKFNRKLKMTWLISCFMVIAGTYYVWVYLYKTPFSVIQFPHRIYALPIFLLSLLIVFEIQKLYQKSSHRNILYIVMIVLSCAMLFSSVRPYWLNELRQDARNQDFVPSAEHPVLMKPVGLWYVTSKTMDNLAKYWTTYGAFDYLPIETEKNSYLLNHQPIQNNQVVESTVLSKPNALAYKGDYKPGNLVLPVVAYNAKYKVVDQNGQHLNCWVNENKQLVAEVTKTTTEVTVTRIVSLSEVISIGTSMVTIPTSIGFAIWYQRKQKNS
ncbi:Uncharacterized membrane protein YfhO (YfhO) [Fructobacillus fructosus]|uniref:6-pyruvoyl-tetrahydropterin synthase-related protein n=1 Tax=Fructobacillus fructosus TaxID=1631 RepID=UPI002D8AD05E|nr:Uncharacterized membrane protein YfhO (YfhO) [Fructobacillus fructosus]